MLPKALAILLMVSWSSACYITACRTRLLGKRLLNKRREETALKQDQALCRPCGPDKLGQCYGPEFCCGPFGCIVGKEELAECSQIVPSELVTCNTEYSSCTSLLSGGICATDKFCCNQETCMSTDMCSSSEAEPLQRQRRPYLLSSILQKIRMESSFNSLTLSEEDTNYKDMDSYSQHNRGWHLER